MTKKKRITENWRIYSPCSNGGNSASRSTIDQSLHGLATPFLGYWYFASLPLMEYFYFWGWLPVWRRGGEEIKKQWRNGEINMPRATKPQASFRAARKQSRHIFFL